MDRIGKEVERELARGGASGAAQLTTVTAVWRATVGETVARNAWPARIGRDGTLHVTASSSTWAFELDRLGEDIRVSLHRELGDAAPVRLRFAVGPVPEPDRPPDAPAPKPSPVPPEIARQADVAASSIADPELRELVARAARASLGRPPSDRRF
jgi:hypothetical protein